MQDPDNDVPNRKSKSVACIYAFLLLARYVPNEAKKSIRDQCKKYIEDRPTDDQRPTSHLGNFHMAISPRGVFRSTSCLVPRWGFQAAILENSNGDISTADRPIYSVFGSRMGFPESAD